MDCKHISTSLSIYRKLHFYSGQSCYKCLHNTPVINQSLKPYGDRQWEQNLTFFKGPSFCSNVCKIHEVWSSNRQATFASSQVSTHTWARGGGWHRGRHLHGCGQNSCSDYLHQPPCIVRVQKWPSNAHLRAVQSHPCCFRPSRLRPGPRTPPAPTPERSAGSCAPPATNFPKKVASFFWPKTEEKSLFFVPRLCRARPPLRRRPAGESSSPRGRPSRSFPSGPPWWREARARTSSWSPPRCAFFLKKWTRCRRGFSIMIFLRRRLCAYISVLPSMDSYFFPPAVLGNFPADEKTLYGFENPKKIRNILLFRLEFTFWYIRWDVFALEGLASSARTETSSGNFLMASNNSFWKL